MTDVDRSERSDQDTNPALALAFGTVALGVLGITALIVALIVGVGKPDKGTALTATSDRKPLRSCSPSSP